MATALASQLTQIRAKSTNSHDLKAQKQAHSQSLLFDPRAAASQDFDLLFQTCYGGFEDLCRIDTRFSQFAKNLFSEQSKEEDRTQMTAAQNQQLDRVVEEFLSLVGSRLLLKPALKAVEWLVRRFRIHEHNTQCLILTFLTYHTAPMFPTVLSLLPSNIPSSLKFLHPYIQSLACPPRHTIVYAASHNRAFFKAFSSYVFQNSRLGCLYSTLVSFWASVATEAVAFMLDQARSSKRESQKQNQEDIVLLLLPILNEGLSSQETPDLRVGCYMVLTVLASKADLNDDTLTAMMSTVTKHWAQNTHAGLICLSVLTQRRENVILSRRVFKSLLAIKNLDDDLKTLGKQYRVSKLVLGVVLGIAEGLKKTLNHDRMSLITRLMEASLMDEASTSYGIEYLCSAARSLDSSAESESGEPNYLADLLLRLTESEGIGTLVKATVDDTGYGVNQPQGNLQDLIGNHEDGSHQSDEDVAMEDVDKVQATNDFDLVVNRIPTRTAYEISFLSHSDSYVWGSLAHAFSLLATSDENVQKFSELPVLRRSLASSEPLFISFYIRLWCGNYSVAARKAAIKTVSKYLSDGHLKADVQILLPYIIYALADDAAKVRRAATKLVLGVSRAYTETEELSDNAALPVLGKDSIYGPGNETTELYWLSSEDCHRLIDRVIVPALPECAFDGGHISKVLSDSLNGSKNVKESNVPQKDLKKSLRTSIFRHLCSNVVNMPSYAVKNRLLPILNQVGRIGSTSRTSLLLPLLSRLTHTSVEEYYRICQAERVDPLRFFEEAMCIITPADPEGIQYLREMIESMNPLPLSGLRIAALHRLRNIWPSMKPDIQYTTATAMLMQAFDVLKRDTGQEEEAGVIETLRSLQLPTAILQSFFEALPSVSPALHDDSPNPKRRRTSHGQVKKSALDSKDLVPAIKNITFVLELVEEAKAERHPELLKGLFQIMCQLQQIQSSSTATTDYLLVVAIDSMLAIVRKSEKSAALRIDHSAIRADVLVDCIRTSMSPQVRNSALLLVSALASVRPDLVLHSVMPIFTFMGTNIIRQEDDFSEYVIRQTMESIIPRLVESLHKRKEGPFAGVCELLLSFAAAFDHIPSQRRFQLFASLINKVGPHEYLFAFLAILIHKHPQNPSVLRFAADLTAGFDVEIRLQTVAGFLDVVLDAQQPKSSNYASLLMIRKDHNVESVAADMLQLPPLLLRDKALLNKIQRKVAGEGEGAATLRSLHEKVLEKIFLLSEQNKSTGKLNVLCMDILDASLTLLPMPDLVEVLQGLLERNNEDIRRQVLQSFQHQLSETKSYHKQTQTACLAFLPRLLTVIEKSPDVALKHTAVRSVDTIAEHFGKKATSQVIEAARTISSDVCLLAADKNLRIASLLCLTTVVEMSGDSFIPIMPIAYNKVLDNLTMSIQVDTEHASLHNAVYAFVSALLLYIPWVIAGSDLDRLLNISYESANGEMGEQCDQRRIEAIQLVSKQLEAKYCFVAFQSTWSNAMIEGPLAVKEFGELLRIAIDRNSKATIVKESWPLGDLFMRMFDLRRIQLSPPTEDSYTMDEIEQVEDTVGDSMIAMIYKLNDATFRPLFARMQDWTVDREKVDDKSKIFRQTTWFNFLSQFFGTLKSIVTGYASLILEDCAEILNTAPLEEEEGNLLWRKVVTTLHKTFEHDQDDFYQSPDHFTPISTALISQLENATKIPLLPELISAIAELAIATDSAAHHKDMNTAILQYMRSDDPSVRLAAVQCERALTERLGEEWLALLPEMLPFIAEALEDDDEDVEREVQRWVVGIEGILGESLNPMLQ